MRWWLPAYLGIGIVLIRLMMIPDRRGVPYPTWRQTVLAVFMWPLVLIFLFLYIVWVVVMAVRKKS